MEPTETKEIPYGYLLCHTSRFSAGHSLSINLSRKNISLHLNIYLLDNKPQYVSIKYHHNPWQKNPNLFSVYFYLQWNKTSKVLEYAHSENINPKTVVKISSWQVLIKGGLFPHLYILL